MKKFEVIEQAIKIIRVISGSSEEVKEEEIEKAIDCLNDSFDLSEKSISMIVKQLEKSTLKKSGNKELDKADLLMLQGLVMKSGIRYDKEKVDFDNGQIDLSYLLKTLEKRLNSLEKEEKREKLKAARKQLEEKGLELNAENLSAEAGISLEEAEKYVNRLAAVSKARSKNPKLQNQ